MTASTRTTPCGCTAFATGRLRSRRHSAVALGRYSRLADPLLVPWSMLGFGSRSEGRARCPQSERGVRLWGGRTSTRTAIRRLEETILLISCCSCTALTWCQLTRSHISFCRCQLYRGSVSPAIRLFRPPVLIWSVLVYRDRIVRWIAIPLAVLQMYTGRSVWLISRPPERLGFLTHRMTPGPSCMASNDGIFPWSPFLQRVRINWPRWRCSHCSRCSSHYSLPHATSGSNEVRQTGGRLGRF